MKWYFAATEATLSHKDHDFPGLMKAAAASARANTDLEPNLIYDGAESALTQDLRAMGVRIHHHALSIAPYLRAHAPADYAVDVALGAFLRTDIPELETEDDFVLYTDCDVLFLRQPAFLRTRPDFFACAPEFDMDDYARFNTGVMLMNLRALRLGLAEFRRFIQQHFSGLAAFDQGAFQLFYRDRLDRLPPVANWKPYWGVSDRAEIVHFHGPKPMAVRKGLADPAYAMPQIWRDLLGRGAGAYPHYLALWDQYRELAEQQIRAGRRAA